MLTTLLKCLSKRSERSRLRSLFYLKSCFLSTRGYHRQAAPSSLDFLRALLRVLCTRRKKLITVEEVVVQNDARTVRPAKTYKRKKRTRRQVFKKSRAMLDGAVNSTAALLRCQQRRIPIVMPLEGNSREQDGIDRQSEGLSSQVACRQFKGRAQGSHKKLLWMTKYINH